MRYIKKFENFERNQPEIGDYVICDIYNVFLNYYRYPEDYKFSPRTINLMKYVSNKVGQIIDYESKKDYEYIIKYDIPEKFLNKFREYRRQKRLNKDNIDRWLQGQIYSVNREDILFYSKDKELCETYIESKKFNL